MKFFDIILEEPLKKALHGVQIKSKASLNEYIKHKQEFLDNYQTEFLSFFFVVHTPDNKLENYIEEEENINLFTIEKIAEFAIDSGLISWVMEKAR